MAVTPPGGTPEPFTFSPSLYGGQPSTTVSYPKDSPADPGSWTVTVPINSVEDPSNLDDIVIVITYDITLPV